MKRAFRNESLMTTTTSTMIEDKNKPLIKNKLFGCCFLSLNSMFEF